MIRVFAPAKINLALHVTGQRPDGYHLLDMLVGFADVGDVVSLTPSDRAHLAVQGPEAPQLQGPNIIADVIGRFAARPYDVSLTKNLPVASGMGGGSSDAAATYRAIMAEQMRAPRAADLLALGADVPMCLACRPAHVRGIGEDIRPLPNLAELSVVLVNPRVQIATPDVFKALTQKENTAIPRLPDRLDDPAVLIQFLLQQRNDLQAPAVRIAPVITGVLDSIAQTGAVLARMSGSGATCFGVYPDRKSAAAAALQINRPDWWVAAAQLNGAIDIRPQVIRATT